MRLSCLRRPSLPHLRPTLASRFTLSPGLKGGRGRGGGAGRSRGGGSCSGSKFLSLKFEEAAWPWRWLVIGTRVEERRTTTTTTTTTTAAAPDRSSPPLAIRLLTRGLADTAWPGQTAPPRKQCDRPTVLFVWGEGGGGGGMGMGMGVGSVREGDMYVCCLYK